jgi:hypothetical protein
VPEREEAGVEQLGDDVQDASTDETRGVEPDAAPAGEELDPEDVGVLRPVLRGSTADDFRDADVVPTLRSSRATTSSTVW